MGKFTQILLVEVALQESSFRRRSQNGRKLENGFSFGFTLGARILGYFPQS